MIRCLLLAATMALAACAKPDLPPPAVEVRTVEVVREVQRPCPVTPPRRPAPLGALPTDAIALAAVLGRKLAEWSGPGGYGERADAALRTCATSSR